MTTGKMEMSCDHCGMTNIVEYTDYPERDKGVVNCAVCGGILHRWKGTRDFGIATAKTPTPEEIKHQEEIVKTLETDDKDPTKTQYEIEKLLNMMNLIHQKI